MRNKFMKTVFAFIIFYSFSSFAEKVDNQMPKVIVYNYGGLSWDLRTDLGEKPITGIYGNDFSAENYFVGDPIYSRLFIGSGSRGVEIKKSNLEEVVKCIGLTIHEINDGKVLRNPNLKGSQRVYVPLDDIEFDKEDEKCNKKVFSGKKYTPDGIHTRWFDLSTILERNLKPGMYQLTVIKDENKCGYKYRHLQGNFRIIMIHEASSAKLKAMKICWDGIRELVPAPGDMTRPKLLEEYMRRSNNRKFMEGLASNYFFPALEIYPKLKCAQKNIAAYYKVLGDRSSFEKYYEMYCKTPWDPRWEKKCIGSMKAQIKEMLKHRHEK